jgi:hypothetical protein
MGYAIIAALVLLALLNGAWAYINMMLADNGFAIGIAAASCVVCALAAVYIGTLP